MMNKMFFALMGFIVGATMGLLAMTARENATPDKYIMTGMITEIDRGTSTYVVTELDGNEWIFRDAQDLEVGDLVACMMSDNGTENKVDDEILAVKYCG